MNQPPTQTLSWHGQKVTLSAHRMYGRQLYVSSKVEGSLAKYTGKLPSKELVNETVLEASLGRKNVTEYFNSSDNGWYIQLQTNKRLTDKQIARFLGQLFIRHEF